MVKRMFFALGQILFLPHLILFFLSSNRNLVIADLYAVQADVSCSKLKVANDLTFKLLRSKYFRTLYYFRINNVGSKVLRIFYPKHASFTIDINTKIDGGLHLAHPYSTILNAESIGSNVYLNHMVTVGEKNGLKPIIRNNVELHAGCIVIGGITIGENVIIGAGAVVVKDVPANCIVVGNPGRILEKKRISLTEIDL